MKANWNEWLREAYDYADCRYNMRPTTDRWERDAWLAWSSGREALDFVDECYRDQHMEP